MPTRFLLGITENPGEFRIDLQNAVTCVEQNDGFWHSLKKPIEEGPLSGKRVQRNVSAFASFPRSGNCSAACKENNSRQNVRWQCLRWLRFLSISSLVGCQCDEERCSMKRKSTISGTRNSLVCARTKTQGTVAKENPAPVRLNPLG